MSFRSLPAGGREYTYNYPEHPLNKPTMRKGFEQIEGHLVRGFSPDLSTRAPPSRPKPCPPPPNPCPLKFHQNPCIPQPVPPPKSLPHAVPFPPRGGGGRLKPWPGTSGGRQPFDSVQVLVLKMGILSFFELSTQEPELPFTSFPFRTPPHRYERVGVR